MLADTPVVPTHLADGVQSLLLRGPGGEIIKGRRRDVLRCLLDGKSEKQAALDLGLSKHTIHVYIKHIYGSFGVWTRPELLVLIYKAVIAELVQNFPERADKTE